MKDNNSKSKERIAIVGGGMMGITAAFELAKTGLFEITIFEKADELGGMSDYYKWDEIVWDRFYHVVLGDDEELLKFISDIGLEDQLFWQKTRTGFYGNGKLVSLSSSLDFIKFPFMSMWEKFRFALGILYSTKIKDPSKLDRIYVRKWLTKVFGRQVYENIWDPLLRSKLGDEREKTSAAFIWASINRQYGARSAGSKIEKMGYVHGGYKAIIEAAKKKLKEYGVKIHTDSLVTKIKPVQLDNDNSKKRLLRLYVNTNNSIHTFDKILFTIPCPAVLENIGINNEHSYWKQLAQVEYLRVVCVFLVLRHRLSLYYVINLLDKELPFTGIIEATNVVSPKELNNKHLVYLPKYMPAGHLVNELKDSEIIELFINKLKKVFPDLKDNDILHKKLFRETYTQPLQKLNFLDRKTGFATPIENVYLVNSSMIYNSTLNNNAIVSLAKKATRKIFQDINVNK